MTSMTICAVLVVELYDQLKNHPITIAMDDKPYEVENVFYDVNFKTSFINFSTFEDSISCHHLHTSISNE